MQAVTMKNQTMPKPIYNKVKAGAGGSIATGPIAIICAHFIREFSPDMPAEVVDAFVVLLVTLGGFVAGYLKREVIS